MTISLYDASVPVLTRYLRQLDAMLDLAAGHTDTGALLDARLAPSMHPFSSQVEITANFAVRACAPLAGRPERDSGDHPATLSGLRARIAWVLHYLDGLPPAGYGAVGPIADQAGDATVSLPPQTYLLHYTLPNFFFHLTCAYALLRHMGVDIGKGDFDGFHLYPRSTT